MILFSRYVYLYFIHTYTHKYLLKQHLLGFVYRCSYVLWSWICISPVNSKGISGGKYTLLHYLLLTLWHDTPVVAWSYWIHKGSYWCFHPLHFYVKFILFASFHITLVRHDFWYFWNIKIHSILKSKFEIFLVLH